MTSATSLAERLREAATAGQADQAKELCRMGATFEVDMEGRTALHLAAANGNLETVQVLIEAGAKVNFADAAGYTPLHQAATEGNVEVVRKLVTNSCYVDAQDELHENTALHEAAWKGYSQTLEVLCKNKANVYIRNKGGFSALHLACQNGHNQSCRILLLAGCKPDIKNHYGDTPLHTAARYGHAGVLRILISAFCHVNEMNKNGDTSLHIAAAMGRRKLTRILLEAGSDQTIRNSQGETAMDIAKRKEYTEVQEILTNPPARVIQVQDKSKTKGHKKREKDSGTSQDSSSKCRKDKHKKSKRGHKVHFLDELPDKKNGHLSPYGCHMFPNLATFPSPNLDSLPPEPLKKGEQYYVDLAGNIKKGPVGIGYTCYCAPFFHNVEKKLEADKQELMDHIDNAHDDLNAKISHLERRTRDHLFNLNQSMKERLAAERSECLERVEQRTLRERADQEKRQEAHAQFLKSELQAFLQGQVEQQQRLHHHGDQRWPPRPRSVLSRSRSEDLLSELDGSSRTDAVSAAGLVGSSVGDLLQRAGDGRLVSGYVQRLRTDFEKLGAKPKRCGSPGRRRTTPPDNADCAQKSRAELRRDSRSEGDLTSCHTRDATPVADRCDDRTQGNGPLMPKSNLSVSVMDVTKLPSASQASGRRMPFPPRVGLPACDTSGHVVGALWNRRAPLYCQGPRTDFAHCHELDKDRLVAQYVDSVKDTGQTPPEKHNGSSLV